MNLVKKKLNLHSQQITSNIVMSRTCQISGKKAMFGNNVSKAINKTKRRFEVNLIKKRFFIPEEGKWISLKLSTRALKTINKNGISSVLKEAKKQGLL